MKTTRTRSPANRTHGAATLKAATLGLALAAVLNWNASAQLALDKMHGYPLDGTASYTATGGGHTSATGDSALDLGTSGASLVTLTDPGFLSALSGAMATDKLSVSLWAQVSSIASASAFWFYSPTVNGTSGRAFQAHLPWNNDNIYFDTSGCCDTSLQRINAAISTFPPYTAAGIGDAWWNSWHHFVFIKNGSSKQIWIDGTLFLEGQNTAPLVTDVNLVAVGSGIPLGGAASLNGQIDDFAIFGTGLSTNEVQAMFAGTAPDALPGANTNLLAYWDFNPSKPILSLVQAGPNATVTPDISAYYVIANGTSAVQMNTIKLWLNGTDVTSQATILSTNNPPLITGSSSGATIYYVSTNLFAAGTTQMVALAYSDNANPVNTYSNAWPVVIQSYNGYVTDTVSQRIGFLEGSAVFTLDKGGRTGATGDRAIDLSGVGAGGDIHVGLASFLNQAAANGTMSVSVWMKMRQKSSGAAVYARSVTSSGGQRGFAGRPWSDNNIYFDTAGCCDPNNQQILTSILNLPSYVDDGFWTQWHHYVFTYNALAFTKEIWVDGYELGLGWNLSPLPTDFRDLLFGYDPGDNAYQQATIDEISVFGTPLTPASISSLTNGALPTALAGETCLAYWNCNTVSPGPPFISLASTPAPGSTNNLPNVGANIIIVNRNTQVQTNTITLAFDGVNMTSQAVISSNSAGANVTFLSPTILPPLTTHRLTVVFSDNAVPPNVVSNSWTFGIGSYPSFAKDVTHGYLGMFRGNTAFTAAGGGHSGTGPDRALDLYTDGGGGATVTDPPFLNALNAAAGQNALTISFWLKQGAARNDNTGAWLNSPSVGRNFNAHTPWGNVLYYDTAGCCAASQRISANINTFAGYTAAGIGDNWWTNWHHFVYVKSGNDKTIYIDGQLFLTGTGTAPLTTDVNALYMGYGAGVASPRGQIDDFAVFGDPLSVTAVGQLFSGISPVSIGATNLLAYFNFDDAGPAFLLGSSRTPTPNTTGANAFGPLATLSAQMIDGSTAVNTNTIRLLLNDTDVTGQASISQPAAGVSQVKLAYAPTAAQKLPSASSNRVTVIFSDNAVPAKQNTNTWAFSVEAYTAVTRDVLHAYEGLIRPAGVFTASGGGVSGQAGDYAVNTTVGGGPVHIDDATFLIPAAAGQVYSLSLWVKKYDIASSSAIWVSSPSSSGSGRGINVHLPWSDNSIYYDTAGCCVAPIQRLNGSITTFPGYSAAGMGTGWWTNWHHFVFLYNAGQKEIWIDGTQFLVGVGANPLPTDFTDMFLGRNAGDGQNMHGVMDEFSAFSTALTPANIALLATGTAPTALTGENLLAYWNFNDATRPAITIKLTGTTISVTYSGILQSANNASGRYADVGGATSPYNIPTSPVTPPRFFRARQ